MKKFLSILALALVTVTLWVFKPPAFHSPWQKLVFGEPEFSRIASFNWENESRAIDDDQIISRVEQFLKSHKFGWNRLYVDEPAGQSLVKCISADGTVNWLAISSPKASRNWISWQTQNLMNSSERPYVLMISNKEHDFLLRLLRSGVKPTNRPPFHQQRRLCPDRPTTLRNQI